MYCRTACRLRWTTTGRRDPRPRRPTVPPSQRAAEHRRGELGIALAAYRFEESLAARAPPDSGAEVRAVEQIDRVHDAQPDTRPAGLGLDLHRTADVAGHAGLRPGRL